MNIRKVADDRSSSGSTYTVEMSQIEAECLARVCEEHYSEKKIKNPRHCIATFMRGIQSLKHVKSGSVELD